MDYLQKVNNIRLFAGGAIYYEPIMRATNKYNNQD